MVGWRAMDDFPFLSERATDHWFLSEYARLIPNCGPPAEASPFQRVGKKFVLAFTGRVGSTLLCQQLIKYGVFVAEFLNPIHLDAQTHVKKADDYHELFARLVDTYALNGAWGVKAHVQSLIPLFRVGEFPSNLDSWRFVYVTRDNIVRQAISLVIAEKRQSYASWIEPAREISDDEYSRDEIARSILDTRLSQELWEKFFETFGVTPLRITYEQIVADPEAAASRIAEHCGFERGGADRVEQFDDPPLSPQTTALNPIWERRFNGERAADANRP